MKITFEPSTTQVTQKSIEMLIWQFENLGNEKFPTYYCVMWAILEVFPANKIPILNFVYKEKQNFIKVEINDDEFFIRKELVCA